MPLRPELKEFIEKTEMTDAYRSQLLKTMENAPDELQAGWLRQSDYDKKMNAGKEELKTKEDELAKKEGEVNDRSEKWSKWKEDAEKVVKDNVSAREGMEAKLTERDEKITELEDKIRSGNFEAGEEGEMLKELTNLRSEVKELKNVAANGDAFTQEQAEKMLMEGGNRLAGNIYDNVFLLMDLNQGHSTEFKEPLDRDAFIKYATERKMVGSQEDFKNAYDLYVSDKRVDAKIEAARKDERTKIESKMQFPLDNDGAASMGKGPVETRLEQLGKEADGGSALTTKQAAMAAAAELRKEGKVAPE